MDTAPTGPLFPFSSDSSVADGVMAAWQTRLAAREAELLAHDADLTLPVTELTARAAELKRQIEERELKIQQLTFELARLKRIRFGAKTEAFSQEQRDLFVDTGTEDRAAVVAELEPASPSAARSLSENSVLKIYGFVGGCAIDAPNAQWRGKWARIMPKNRHKTAVFRLIRRFFAL